MMLKLRDIKTIVDIPDNSLIYLLLVCIIGFIIVYFVGYYIWSKFKKKKIKNTKKITLEMLRNLDFCNVKSVAYNFSLHAEILINNSNKAEFKQINTELLKYKYKKEVDDLSPELITKIQEFIGV